MALRLPVLLAVLLQGVLAQQTCPPEVQQEHRVVPDIIRSAVSESTQRKMKFRVSIHLGPMDKYPYTHEEYVARCGDHPVTVESYSPGLSTFTDHCYFQSGLSPRIFSSGGPQTQGCDTWVDVGWADQGTGRNYSVMAFNAKGTPLWVVHSVKKGSDVMDLTNCFAWSDTQCSAHHPRHRCVWQDLSSAPLTGTNQATHRCAGNNVQGGFIDLNYHGPIDLNAQLGSQATQPGQRGGGQADSWYAGILKEHASQGQTLQGMDRITFVLFEQEVPDHPKAPWLPDPANLHLSFKTQFLKPLAVQWYWTVGLDVVGQEFRPFACTVVPQRAHWDKPVTVTFDCTDCRARVFEATGVDPPKSSDTTPTSAWDSDPTTAYASWHPSGVWTRAKLRKPSRITRLRFRPAAGKEAAMLNGRFTATTATPREEELLAVVQTTPAPHPQWTELYVYHTKTLFSYVTYHAPSSTHGWVADIEIFTQCTGPHALQSNMVKAVKAGEGCDAPPAYGTTEGRTDLECLFRPTSECFSFKEKCRWDVHTKSCEQHIPAARRTFTFRGGSGTAGVNFCFEGEIVWPNGTLLITPDPSTLPTPTPTPSPLPVPTTPTPLPSPAPRTTPYPVFTTSPPVPHPPPPSPPPPPPPSPPPPPPPPPLTPAPTTPPTPEPRPPPTRSPLDPADLALSPPGVGYQYLSDQRWLATSAAPLRTIILSPRVAPAASTVQCNLVTPYAAMMDPPLGTHSLPSSLTGDTAPLLAGKAVFLNMTITIPFNRRSLVTVACSVRTDKGEGPAFTKQVVVFPAGIGTDGEALSDRIDTLTVLVAIHPTDIVLDRVKEAIAAELGLPPTDVRIALAAGQRRRAQLLQTALQCIEDPTPSRSTLLHVQMPPAALRSTLRLAVNTSSPLARALCGIFEAYIDPQPPIPSTHPDVPLSRAPPGLSATPPPLTVGKSDDGDSMPDAVLVLVIIALVLCALVCAVVVFLRFKKREKREGEKRRAQQVYKSGPPTLPSAPPSGDVLIIPSEKPPTNPISATFGKSVDTLTTASDSTHDVLSIASEQLR